jgi:hypothetical protein
MNGEAHETLGCWFVSRSWAGHVAFVQLRLDPRLSTRSPIRKWTAFKCALGLLKDCRSRSVTLTVVNERHRPHQTNIRRQQRGGIIGTLTICHGRSRRINRLQGEFAHKLSRDSRIRCQFPPSIAHTLTFPPRFVHTLAKIAKWRRFGVRAL